MKERRLRAGVGAEVELRWQDAVRMSVIARFFDTRRRDPLARRAVAKPIKHPIRSRFTSSHES